MKGKEEFTQSDFSTNINLIVKLVKEVSQIVLRVISQIPYIDICRKERARQVVLVDITMS